MRFLVEPVLTALAKLAAFCAAFFYLCLKGRSEKELKIIKQGNRNNEDAKKIRDRVSLDPDYRDNVRRLFDGTDHGGA